MAGWLKDLVGAVGSAFKEVSNSSDDPRSKIHRSSSLWVCNQQDDFSRPSGEERIKPFSFEALIPRYTLSDVHGMSDVTAAISGTLLNVGNIDAPRSKNGLLLYGPPGVGKTFLLECCAGELKMPIVWLTIGVANSMWVGEKTAKVKQAFEDAKAQSPCILFIDEIDSFLVRRENIANADSETALIVNTFLTELDALRSTGVKVVGATNFIERLDSAAIREGRFDWKIFIPHPDALAREALIKTALGDRFQLDEKLLQAYVQHWEGFSVARIVAVVNEAMAMAQDSNEQQMSAKTITAAWVKVRGAPPNTTSENLLSIDELYLQNDLKEALKGLSNRMSNFVEIGLRGGTIPKGVMFYGPPGTGKTVAARALGKDSGWNTVVVRGTDILSDPSRIDKAVEQAISYRPSVIFIDEADDVLANRTASITSHVTNKLLQIIDGGDSSMKDILFVAATNHPDAIDPAMLRGGRFGLQLLFEPPDREMVREYCLKWLHKKGFPDPENILSELVLDSLTGRTIADITEALQSSLNLAIDRGLDSHSSYKYFQQMLLVG